MNVKYKPVRKGKRDKVHYAFYFGDGELAGQTFCNHATQEMAEVIEHDEDQVCYRCAQTAKRDLKFDFVGAFGKNVIGEFWPGFVIERALRDFEREKLAWARIYELRKKA